MSKQYIRVILQKVMYLITVKLVKDYHIISLSTWLYIAILQACITSNTLLKSLQ